MPGKFYNLDTDITLGGENASDFSAVSQKAVKYYIDHSSGGIVVDNKLSNISENPLQNKVITNTIMDVTTGSYYIYGYPTISNNIISDMSTSDYILTDYVWNCTSSDSWDLTIKIQDFDYTLANSPMIFTNSLDDTKSIEIGFSDYKLHIKLSSDGSTWDIADVVMDTSTFIGGGVSILLMYHNSEITVGQTTTQGYWMQLASYTNSVYNTNSQMKIYNSIGSTGISIDLANSSMIVNSTTVWDGSDGATTFIPKFQERLVSGTNIKTVNNISLLGSGNISIDSLPSQSGQSGKFLTTNGTIASWANIPTEIPTQSGNSGKFLTTNGSSVSWSTVPSATVDQIFDGTSTNAQSGVAIYTALTNGTINPIFDSSISFSDNVTEIHTDTEPDENDPNIYINTLHIHSGIIHIDDLLEAHNGLNVHEGLTIGGAGLIDRYEDQSDPSIHGLIITDSSDSTSIVLTDSGAYYNGNEIATQTWVGNQGYITGITSSDVTTALGYTPYNSSNPDGYISGITGSDVTTALGYTPYNSTNPDGYITGITNSDVITALGFTPYDSTNPNGYTSNVGTVTSVNNIQPDSSGNVTITVSSIPPIGFGTSDTAAATVTKVVSIPEITELNVGQLIVVNPTVTSTVASMKIKLNDFDAVSIVYGGSTITTSTDSIVWSAYVPSVFVYDMGNDGVTPYWRFVCHGQDLNTTYTLNYLIDAGQYTAGSGAYAITRYSLIMQRPGDVWEKLTATNATYSTGTSKSVNTGGFDLGAGVKYYATTTTVANGALTAANIVRTQTPSVDMRYSTNCGATPGWTVGNYVYLVGTIGVDGLFYLDSTTWWTNTLPSTNDGKVYVRLGHVISDYSIAFYENNPVFYHDGTSIRDYILAGNKQDTLVSGTNIKTVNNESLLGSGNIDVSGGGATIDDTTPRTTTVYSSQKTQDLIDAKEDKFIVGEGIVLEEVTVTIPNDLTSETSSDIVYADNYEGTYYPYMAFDGDENTKWGLASTPTEQNPRWIVRDLGDNYPIARVVIKTESSSETVNGGYVQGSNDKTNWTNIGTIDNTGDTTKIITCDSTTTYRYIRLYCTSVYGSGWGKVNEMTIYTSAVKVLSVSPTILNLITDLQDRITVLEANINGGNA